MQIYFSGNSSLEGAINWVEEHSDDADIDTMLLVEKKDAVCRPFQCSRTHTECAFLSCIHTNLFL